jgi:hypothetical protein
LYRSFPDTGEHRVYVLRYRQKTGSFVASTENSENRKLDAANGPLSTRHPIWIAVATRHIEEKTVSGVLGSYWHLTFNAITLPRALLKERGCIANHF